MNEIPWLLIDEVHAPHAWGLEVDTLGLIATSNEVQLLAKGVPVGLRNPKLLLLLLDSEQKFPLNRLSGLAEAFHSEPRWNAWCHYGGNISLSGDGGYLSRWKTWTGLDNQSKDWVRKANADAPPLPFSHLQKLPWSNQFHKVKRIVSTVCEKQAIFGDRHWRLIAKLLHTAHAKARWKALTETSINALNQTLSAVSHAESIFDAIEAADRRPYELAVFLVDVDGRGGLFHRCGYADHRATFEFISSADHLSVLGQHYRSSVESLDYLSHIMSKSAIDNTSEEPDDRLLIATLNNLHSSTAALCKEHSALSVEVTELLRSGKPKSTTAGE